MKRNAKRKWFTKPEMLVAISALITSLVAVIVAMYSAYIDRAYAKASVWPSVLITRSIQSNRYEYIVVNQGNGPAIVNYVTMKVNGQPVSSWQDVLHILAPESEASFQQSHIGAGVIRPGQHVSAFVVTEPDLVSVLQDASFEVSLCYCSIYEDCWITSGIEAPQAVNACVLSDKNRFIQ